MSELFNIDKNYSAWLKELKNRFRKVQLKAAVKVNSEPEQICSSHLQA